MTRNINDKEISQSTATNIYKTITATTADPVLSQLGEFKRLAQEMVDTASSLTGNVHMLQRASDMSGGVVKLLPEYRHIPVIIGKDGKPVLLYHLVEEIEGLSDYEDLRSQFPTLSYAQIAAAFAFLRKVSQFNSRNVDVDEIESAYIESDPGFQERLVDALSDREGVRVLNSE